MTTNDLEKKPASFSDWVRKRGEKLLAPVARGLNRLGLTPNAVTLFGLALNLGVAAVLAMGYTAWGGWLLLVAGIFDALDGALARQMGHKTRFGAFLDSTSDRYSEAAIFLGLTIPFLQSGMHTQVILIYISLVGSVLISYTRARAEGLGLECKVGLLTRFERLLILALALLLNRILLVPALWLLAVLTNFTALQRIVHVWRITRGNDRL